jgi:hypothetical protein
MDTSQPKVSNRKGSEPKLNVLQQAQLKLLGYTRIGEIRKKGWTSALPLYAIICEKHGLVTDYPHGFEGQLRCPLCEKPR